MSDKDGAATAKTPFFKGVKAEFKKIVWPDRPSLFNQSVAVIVVSLILGVLIAIIDRVLQFGINAIIG